MLMKVGNSLQLFGQEAQSRACQVRTNLRGVFFSAYGSTRRPTSESESDLLDKHFDLVVSQSRHQNKVAVEDLFISVYSPTKLL